MYPEQLVAPMRTELVNAGFQELKDSSAVDTVFSDEKGTVLLMINSVCGCAAGTARPGVVLSLEHEVKPEKLVTVFAGMEADAVKKAREYLLPYPPSSPAIALFKDGKLVHMIERRHIEGRSAQMIAANLKAAFDEFCN
ncbi:MAG: BrxA/BrxB family bacilliredoxin [Bacteroidia bacterium]|nr:BrxA/BrxB family bacilliredoxin [Bacteroidia bacterium]